MSPSMRSFGRSPATICKSDALRETISSSSARRLIPCGFGGSGFMGRKSSFGAVMLIVFSVCRGVRARLSDDLVQRTDTLDDLEPPIHAEGEHAFLDRGLLDFGRPGALH